MKVQYNVHECTYPRLKVQRCRSLSKLSSHLPRTIKGCNTLRQNNKTMHHTRMTARCLFMREVTLMYHLWKCCCQFRIYSFFNTTLVPYLYTNICNIVQVAQYPLPRVRLINLITITWWQVLPCLWLCWCLQLSALLSWLSSGGRSLTLTSTVKLLCTKTYTSKNTEAFCGKKSNIWWISQMFWFRLGYVYTFGVGLAGL